MNVKVARPPIRRGVTLNDFKWSMTKDTVLFVRVKRVKYESID